MDELDLLRDLAVDESPSPTARDAARAALMTRADAERPGRTWRPSFGRLQLLGLLGPRRRLLGVTAALAIVFSVAIGQLPFGPRPDPAAAGVLEDVARVAAAQPAGPTDGYRYTKSEGAALCTSVMASTSGSSGVAAPQGESLDGTAAVAMPSVLVPTIREIWIKPDGSGRIRETQDELVFFSAADRERWIAAGSPDLCGPRDWDQRFLPASATPPPDKASDKTWPGSLYFVDMDALPTDVAALTQYVRQRATGAGASLEAEMFTVVGDLLRETVATPAVRAALYRVAAGIPGVELVGSVTDRAGRAGTAVALTAHLSGSSVRTRHTLIFDPVSSLLLGEEEVLLDRADWIDAAPPVAIGYETYLVSDIVATDD